jgi:hypothetical protein
MVQANQTSNVVLWVGRIISGLVIAFMLLDGMKLVPMDVVISTSEQMGIPGSLARRWELSVSFARCSMRYRVLRCSVPSS